MSSDESKKTTNAPDACPHCGHALSRWEQVLLSVDRALMCKNCWYRIILDLRDTTDDQPKDDKSKG